jgi:hypothetical protein
MAKVHLVRQRRDSVRSARASPESQRGVACFRSDVSNLRPSCHTAPARVYARRALSLPLPLYAQAPPAIHPTGA